MSRYSVVAVGCSVFFGTLVLLQCLLSSLFFLGSAKGKSIVEKTQAEKTSAFVGFFLDRRVKRTKWSATNLAAIIPVACTHPSSHAESLQFGLPAAGGGVVERIEV